MRQIPVILSLMLIMLVPVYASAQTSDRITILDNFGTFEKGEPIFIFGEIANLSDDYFLIMQIINPLGDLCQIQQLSPQPNGVFITDTIPLQGRICGVSGEYEIKLFYGDDTKSTTFNLISTSYSEIDSDKKVELAQELISKYSHIISNTLIVPSPTPNPTSTDLTELESTFVNLLDEFFVDELFFEIDPTIRSAVSSSLDSITQLLVDEKITPELAESINKTIFASVFNYEIGDKSKGIGLLSDAFVDTMNVNPKKISNQRILTFDELEGTLLNLMKKTDSIMSKSVKNEVAFIFARGTAPVFATEITELIDMLSKSRYLDVISRKQTDLYRLVQNDWESLKPSLQDKNSIEELLESKTRVADLHAAAILLKELDDVERFISSDSEENGALANLIQPDWSALENDLTLATSVSNILDAKDKIHQMSKVIDISSRISKIIEISQSTDVNSGLIADWHVLLVRVDGASSVDEILTIVSEFDQTITELREKRNPLTVLEFEYKSMKQKAELQADYENLVLINNALKIIKTAKAMESANPSITRIDRIEVLLSWASDIAPKIKSELDSYNKDASKLRSTKILEYTKSIENLVELSMTKNRFLPNYIEFAEKFNERIDDVRDLVIKKDLAQADTLSRELFEEWQLVSAAYAKDPYGSVVGYSTDELKRIDLRKKLDAFANVVETFHNAEFAAHNNEYDQIMDDAYNLVDIGNFIDAEKKIIEVGDYLSEYLALSNPSIIFNISFDPQNSIWIVNGATEKSSFDRRENLYVTIYNMDGSTHSSLEFTDTRQGNFYTQWEAPTDPGLYVISLQYKDLKATQIVHVEEQFTTIYDKSDLDMTTLARQFSELESFAKKFGGDTFNSNLRFASIINEIKSNFVDKDTKKIDSNMEILKNSIERYLPVRSRLAVIESVYDDDKLVISGAVQKSLEFSEDLFVDIYDQRGDRIREIALKDNSSGLFTQIISSPFDSGIYVVQLQHHNVTVTDFFNVR